MPTTLIFGGSGKVARHLTRLLAAESPAHKIYSIIRNPDQSADITSLGGSPIVQSIEDSSVADFAATIRRTSPDYVVWAAGAGGGNPQRTKAVDHEGAIKSMDAAAEAGVKRYVIVSAIDVRDRSKGYPSWYDQPSKERSDAAWDKIGAYLEAKFAADKDLRDNNSRRGLDYTIVRPGGLSQDPGVGTVAAGKVGLNATISREDVARVIIEVLKEPKTAGLAFDVVGGQTSITDAVKAVADGKIDTFEGQY